MEPNDLAGRLTRDDDVVRGTDGDDTVSVPHSNANFQPADVIELGAGFDTLLTERTGYLALAASKFANSSGIDAIDMRSADELRFAGDAALLAQSDDGTIRLVFGDVPLSLDLRDMEVPEAGYILDGTGRVVLEDTEQVVTVADGVDGTVRGGFRADTLLGGTGDDTLSAGSGHDVVRGGGGADVIEGGGGHDDLSGGAGDDLVSGGEGFDHIAGGGGDDTLSGGANADVFVLRPGDTVTITDFDADDPYEQVDLRGFDVLTFRDMIISDADDGARVQIDDSTLLSLQGVAAADVTDSSFTFADQKMVSLAEAQGTEADFFFTASADDFRGGAGSQIFELTGSFSKLSEADRFDGGPGIDTLRVTGEDRALSNPRLAGMQGIEIVDMSGATGDHIFFVAPAMLAQSDNGTLTIRHGKGSLSLEAVAPAGAVTVEGMGAVRMRPDEGQAVTISDVIGGDVTGGEGGDRIAGGARSDRIDGGAGDDTLTGGTQGDDTLIGGEGDDTFRLGGAGDVTVTGGEGHDKYVIDPGAGRITITDFDTTSYLERIDLSATDIRGARDVSLSIRDGDVHIAGDGLDLVLEGAAGARFGLDDFLVAGQRDDRFRIEADAPISALQPLLDKAPDGSVITLGAGTFDMTQPLRIARSDITVKGSGEDRTVLVSAIPDNELVTGQGHFFLVMPEEMERPLGLLAADAAKGSRTVELEPGHGMRAGDLFFVNQPNDDAWLAETGNTGWAPVDPGEGREDRIWLREFRSRIESVDGNTLTLSEPLPYAFAGGVAVARDSIFLSDVHLSDFTMRGRWGAPDPYDFTNTLPRWAHTSGIELDGVQSSSLRNITAQDLASSAFRLQRAHEVEAHDLTAIGAHNKGGGNGLHVLVTESFSTTVTGLTSIGARHAYEFSAYSAEHYNFAQIDFTDRDINFHGSPDSGNTVRVDRMVMDYPSLVFPQWSAVHPGTFPLHPYTTIEDNDVTFLHAETADRNDALTANDAGGFLSTGYDNDTLTGGAGDDTLIGGTQSDVLTGNGGSDRFVWGRKDGVDIITDFETGRGGDVLVFRGTGFTDVSQLRFERSDGQNVLDLGQFREMRFGDTDLRGFNAHNVAFEDAPGKPVEIEMARAAHDVLLGSSGDDRIGFHDPHVEMEDFVLAMGSGDDTAVVLLDRFEGAFHKTGSYGGVDTFDFSALETGSLAISAGLVAQSDAGVLTLAMGDRGQALTLSAGGFAADQTLLVDGARAVRLSDGAANEVGLTDRAGGTVLGGARADTVTGGAADDTIRGGGGDDRIGGGAGADRLTGGAGRDAFVFKVPGDGFRGVDRITDFTKGQDRIVLDIPDGLFAAGRLPAGVFSDTGAPQDRGDRVLYDQGSGRLSIDVDGTGPGGATVIAILGGNPDLAASDIFLT